MKSSTSNKVRYLKACIDLLKTCQELISFVKNKSSNKEEFLNIIEKRLNNIESLIKPELDVFNIFERENKN
jgi:hypothetical protein